MMFITAIFALLFIVFLMIAITASDLDQTMEGY